MLPTNEPMLPCPHLTPCPNGTPMPAYGLSYVLAYHCSPPPHLITSSHPLPPAPQLKLFDTCGGEYSGLKRNAADPSLCCPASSACTYINHLLWRCQPAAPTWSPSSCPAGKVSVLPWLDLVLLPYHAR